MERKVATANRLFRAIHVADNTGAAAHRGNGAFRDNALETAHANLPILAINKDFPARIDIVFGSDFTILGNTVATNLLDNGVIGKLELIVVFVADVRGVELVVNCDTVRVEAAGETCDTSLFQIVVRVARKIGYALHVLEDKNREDCGKSVTEACHLCCDKVARNETTATGSVEAEVQAAERNLVAGAGLQGVEVVYETFHRLVGIVLGLDVSLNDSLAVVLCDDILERLVEAEAVLCHLAADSVGFLLDCLLDFCTVYVIEGLEIKTSFGQHLFGSDNPRKILLEGHVHIGGEFEVEVCRSDATELLVRLELQNYGGDRCGRLD